MEHDFCSATTLLCKELNILRLIHSSLQNLDDHMFFNSVCFSSACFFCAFFIFFLLSLVQLNIFDTFSAFSACLICRFLKRITISHKLLFLSQFQLFYFIISQFPPFTLGLLLLLLLIFQVHHVPLPCRCSRHQSNPG